MKRHAPAADRNRDPILNVLRRVLPAEGLVLEIASGTGQHAAYFASQLAPLQWQPSDVSDEAIASIDAWTKDHPLDNLRPVLRLDVTDDVWPLAHVAAIVCINMIHISPWEACEALIVGAASVLDPGGTLFTYGPYLQEGVETAPSNLAFDASLRERDPRFGIRRVEDVRARAAREGLELEEIVPMPANNLSLVFRRT